MKTPFDLGQENVLCSIDANDALNFVRRINRSRGMSRYVFLPIKHVLCRLCSYVFDA